MKLAAADVKMFVLNRIGFLRMASNISSSSLPLNGGSHPQVAVDRKFCYLILFIYTHSFFFIRCASMTKIKQKTHDITDNTLSLTENMINNKNKTFIHHRLFT